MIFRGLWERRALALIVLLIAVVPIASAAMGPIYSAAAATTIVRDVAAGAPVEGRGWRYTTRGSGVETALARFTQGAGFTGPPVMGLETSSGRRGENRVYPLLWQAGQCEHLRLARGRCAAASLEVMASQASGLKVGGKVLLTSVVSAAPGADRRRPVPLRVVGLYRPDTADDPFWFGRTLFSPSGEQSEEHADALFTVPQTRLDTYVVSAGTSGWTEYGIVGIVPRRLAGTDLDRLAAMQAVAEAVGRDSDAAVFSRVADTVKAMREGVGSLGVPALLVVGQLVGLGWLLLFQTVGDLVRARGPEIALARLRGHGRSRVWRFALAEPLLVLAAAVPLGLAAGGVAARLMVGALLPAGIPAVFPAEAAVAGVVATLGGLVAAVIAAWRSATRPVTEEWRRTPRRSARGWVLDAMVLAVTALGLVELLGTGVIAGVSGQNSGALAVPGLMALAMALLVSRALPLLARRLFGVTRRHGGLGPFLALRQVVRGPVTAGSVIVLGTAFGLATFAVSAWTATSDDYRRTAAFHNGAASAVMVEPVEPRVLAAAVAAADPGGTSAVPVIRVPGTPQFVAADAGRLAKVGHWQPELAGGTSLATAAAALPGTRNPRVMVKGDRLRVTVRHGSPPKQWTVLLRVTFRIPGDPNPAEIPVGPLRAGKGVKGGSYEWNLPGACAAATCELRAVHGDLSGPGGPTETPFMAVTLTGLAVRDGGHWTAVPRPRWSVDEDPSRHDGTFYVSTVGNQTLRPSTYGPAIPAIVVGPVGKRMVPGLDNRFAVGVRQVASAAAAPGLDDTGVLVDLEDADRIAYGVHPRAEFQVWTGAEDTGPLERALREQGLTVVSTRHAADLAASYAGQGPGLALMLLLVSALAAAALALGRTVLALRAAARRRGYELAALSASGARVAALRLSLLLEQVITVAAGTLAGLLGGLLAAGAALPRIPQFARPVITPPLAHEVAAAPVALVTGGALLASLAIAALVSELLLRDIRVERLREAPA